MTVPHGLRPGLEREQRRRALVAQAVAAATGDRFVGRVSLTVDLLATPLPPPRWVDGD